LPSAPAVTSLGDESAVVTGNSLIVWLACATAGTANRQMSTQRSRRLGVGMYPQSAPAHLNLSAGGQLM
jgi:hypothetical protein